MFLLLVSFCLVLWILLFRYRRRRMYELASAIPAPKEELPLLGLAHSLTGNTEDIMNALQRFSYEAMNHDGIVRGWLGHILYFVAVNPVDVEAVLKSCLEKDDLHRFMRNIIGYGGIFAPVAIWRKRRKILIPAFTPKIVESFMEIFSQQSEKLVSRLNECVGRGKVSVWPYISRYTLDAVCESAMGIRINAQDDPKTPFLRAMQNILHIVCKRIFHLWLQPDWLFKLFPEYHRHEKNIKVLQDFTDEVIKKKRESLKKGKSLQPEDDSDFGKNLEDYFLRKNKRGKFRHSYYFSDLSNYRRQSFLDHLINLSGGEKGYSNQELREEVLTLIIAGTDTSAVAIGYTLKLLAKYPKVQEKLFEELQDVFGGSNRPLIKKEVFQLKYLDRVVKESLRLFPPVPFIIRKVLKEISLPSGVVLPAGSGVAVSIWGIHRDPKYWGPDAECFDPDRFLPERFNLQHPCSYMPFSNGPRNCAGYQYALMSVKTAVSSIVRCYKVMGVEESGSVPHIKCKIDIMMKDVDEYKIGLEKRSVCAK